MEAETVGAVLMALATIVAAFAAVAKPMIQLNATITRLEAVLTALQDRMAEVSGVIKSQDSRLDRAETVLIEYGLRIDRLEEECERRYGRWRRRRREDGPRSTRPMSRPGSKRSGSGPRRARPTAR